MHSVEKNSLIYARLSTLAWAACEEIRGHDYTVGPRFNRPLYSEVIGITNDIFQPSNSVMYGKEPLYNEPSI